MADYILKILLLIWVLQTPTVMPLEDRSCPEKCRCSLDEKARKLTACEDGGIFDLIPVAEMAPETEVLVITGSEHLPNNLSLGPIFKGLTNLEEIHLTWSGIPSLGEHSFWGLGNLRVLNVTHNELNNLVETNFRGASSLKYLDLSGNEIESVPSAAFRHVKHLISLSLADNIIPKLVPRIFFGLTRLQILDLSYNPLGDLQPELFSDVPVLQKLSCAGCGLMSISGSLLNMLPELRFLDLQNNRLTQIPHRLPILQKLEVLELDGNHISFVEREAISGSPLTHLHLGHNHIIRVETNAFVNSSITHLDISYNRLSSIEPEGFSDAINQIYDLKLSGNSLQIDNLLKLLPEAENLRRLSIGDIGLTLLPAGLMHHTYSLRYLNLSANYLSVLPIDLFSSTPNLLELDISYNSFRGLSEEVLRAISNTRNLRVLGLKGNPWYCDQCHVSPLIKWLQDSPDQLSTCDDSRVWTCLTCIGPKSFSEVSLSLLPNSDIPKCVSDPDITPFVKKHPGKTTVPASFSDDSSSPISHLTRSKSGRSIANLFAKELPLIVIGLCSFVIVILCLIVSAVIAYSRHSAYYYTNEKDLENTSYFVSDKLRSPDLRNGEKDFENGQCQTIYGNGTTCSPLNRLRKSNRNNNTAILLRPTLDTTSAAIATIDELADIAGSSELVDAPSPNKFPNYAGSTQCVKTTPATNRFITNISGSCDFLRSSSPNKLNTAALSPVFITQTLINKSVDTALINGNPSSPTFSSSVSSFNSSTSSPSSSSLPSRFTPNISEECLPTVFSPPSFSTPASVLPITEITILECEPKPGSG